MTTPPLRWMRRAAALLLIPLTLTLASGGALARQERAASQGGEAGDPLYGPGGAPLSTNLMARMGQLSQRLTQGHQALRALDMGTAREVAAWVNSLDEGLRQGLGARYYLARYAFYEGRYDEGLALLAEPEAGEPGEVAQLRQLLTNLSRIVGTFEWVESEHFRVGYQPGPDAVLIPYLVETLEKSYLAIGAELGHLPTERIRVEIFPTSDDFIAVSSLTRQEIKTTGIIALCVFNKLMLTSPRALALGYRWLDTASHEYIHQVVGLRTDNQVPVWLQEGLAKFFEVRWRGGRGADLDPSSESLLAEALATGNFVPFEKMSPSVAKLPSQEEAQLAFAQVQTFIEMITAEKGLDGIRALLAAMKGGLSDQEAVAEVMGMPFPQVEAHWRSFVADKRPQRLEGVSLMPIILQAQALAAGEEPPEGEDKITDPFMAQNKALREFARLGDLLRERERYRAALIEYAKAEDASKSDSPALQVKIAQTLMAAGDTRAALERLERVTRRYDGFGPAWTALGEARLSLGDSEGALTAFEEANASNPFDPAVHVRLAQLHEAAGRAEDAAWEKEAVAIVLGRAPTSPSR